MGCTNCPPDVTPTWCTCKRCTAQYKPYEHIESADFCPKCADVIFKIRAAAAQSLFATGMLGAPRVL